MVMLSLKADHHDITDLKKIVLNASYLIKHVVILSEFSRINTVYIEILIILQVYMNIEINEGNHYAEIKWLIINLTMKKPNKIKHRRPCDGEYNPGKSSWQQIKSQYKSTDNNKIVIAGDF